MANPFIREPYQGAFYRARNFKTIFLNISKLSLGTLVLGAQNISKYPLLYGEQANYKPYGQF